jgi:hypothetical protein
MLSRIASILGAAAVLISCGGSGSSDGPTQPSTPSVASVTISPADSVVLVAGGIAQLGLSIRAADGSAVIGKTVTWSSSDNAKVSVSSSGQVTGQSVGRATITASSGGKSGTTTIVVASILPSDYAIVRAQFTQGVQDSTGSIPMILSGLPAVVNVLVSSTATNARATAIVLRLTDASGAVVYTDTAITRGTLTTAPTFVTPTAQFLVPASKLAAGLKWQVVRDPNGLTADKLKDNDVFPATGPQTLATASVPPLNIVFVPIVLASNGNSTPVLTDANIPDYLRTLRSIHPLGVMNTRVGPSFTTSASFGTAPTGGAQAFWTQALADLDLARIADPTNAASNWYGVVAPPSGFNFTTFGGFSYIPSNGTTFGPHTRTTVAVRTGWFSNPTQARDLVAHEIGHTFGRSHAPCGNAGSPLDLNYPVAGGVLDVIGHDVYAWANGLATSAVVVPASTGDVMGYCFPVWASTYTYKAVLAFRTPTVIAARAADETRRTRVIIVRGSIDNEKTLKIEPAFTLDASPTTSDPNDNYRVEGVDADGRVSFSSTFTPAAIDHAPTLKHFAVAVPVTGAIEDGLSEIRVVGLAGTARLTRSAPTLAASELRPSAVRRIGSSAATISCGDASSRGVLILDEATGAVRGAASSGSIAATVEAGQQLSVLCSDGLRTRHASVKAP